MKKLLKGIALVTVIFIVYSCGSLKNKDITGEKEIKQVFKTKQFKDSNDVFYAIVVGEHGDEMEAKNLALAEARLQFTTKGSSMVESAVKKDGTRSMNDRIGSLDLETKSLVISKAVSSYMYEVDSKLFYSEIRGTYIYRAVYKIETDNIISLLKQVNK